jgi:hypothetical protein
LLAVDIQQKHHAARSYWPCGDIPIEICVEPSVAPEMITLDVDHIVLVVASAWTTLPWGEVINQEIIRHDKAFLVFCLP